MFVSNEGKVSLEWTDERERAGVVFTGREAA